MLAAAGVVFQGLLRNPLATPFTLGVSAGAALGAMLAITFGCVVRMARHPGRPARQLHRLARSRSAIVYALARARHRGLSTNVLLLAGVTMNAFFSALILFVQYFADFAQTYRILRWLMGDLDVSSYQPLLTALPLVLVAFARVRLAGAAAEPAQPRRRSGGDRGLERRCARSAPASSARRSPPARRCRSAVPSASSASSCRTSSACSSAPTTASSFRRRRSSARRFSIACDVVARTVMAPLELPVGVITALIGGPFFLWLLVRRA